MKFETHDFTVGAHFAPALVNGDYSGLSDAEAEDLNSWINNSVPPGAGHWSGFDEERREEFTRCEVTGLHGVCYRAQWLRPVKP